MRTDHLVVLTVALVRAELDPERRLARQDLLVAPPHQLGRLPGKHAANDQLDPTTLLFDPSLHHCPSLLF